jgi:hypothetical protein
LKHLEIIEVDLMALIGETTLALASLGAIPVNQP